jgi:hypothetical protein
MSVENALWGAPRIHGELLKLGFEVAQSSVAKYMVKRRGPPSQVWRTFLHNHAPDIAAMDLFVVPTIGFDLLFPRPVHMGRSGLRPMRRDDPPRGPPTYMRSDLSCDRRHKVPMVMDIIAINCCRQPFAARFPISPSESAP